MTELGLTSGEAIAIGTQETAELIGLDDREPSPLGSGPICWSSTVIRCLI